jgi:hypothetical protein
MVPSLAEESGDVMVMMMGWLSAASLAERTDEMMAPSLAEESGDAMVTMMEY